MAGAGVANITGPGRRLRQHDDVRHPAAAAHRDAPVAGQPADDRRGNGRIRRGEHQFAHGLFDRIVQANSRYYVLGYYPPTHPRDGRFHKIEVRVEAPRPEGDRAQGIRIAARQDARESANATKKPRWRATPRRARSNDTSAPLREVLGSPMQQGGLTFSVQAAPFRNTDKQASVALAIEFEGSNLQFASTNGTFADNIELSFYGIDEAGKASTGHAQLPETGAQAGNDAAREGVRLPRRIPDCRGPGTLPGAHRRRERRQRQAGVGVLRPSGPRLSRRIR